MIPNERISELKDEIGRLDKEIAMNAGFPYAINDSEKRKALQEELAALLETEKKMSVLTPLNTSEEKKVEEYHKGVKLGDIFERIGGGYLVVTTEDTDNGIVLNAFFVRRDKLNNKGEPLPDGETLDVQATRDDIKQVMCDYTGEISFSGIPGVANEKVVSILGRRNFGYVTRERRNQDEEDTSVEKVEIRLMSGNCLEAKDNQYTRAIILVRVSPDGKITYRNFASESIDMHNLLIQDCNEKSALAVLMLRDICKEINE